MPEHTERPEERNAWDEADDRRCAEFLGRGRCALVAGHAGSHVPLPVVWQQAGYEDGEWSGAGLLASLERVEAERDRLAEALTNLRRAFNRMPDAGLHDGDPRRAWWFETFTEREAARQVLASLDREDEG